MKLSIVVPTYNRRQLLQRCVDSVLIQIASDVELIVIDDGSTDDTLAYLRECTSSNIHFSFFVQPCNLGVNAARNVGIRAALGKYILFLDSDDYLTRGSIQIVLTHLNNSPYTHYLFLVSDRVADLNLPNQDHNYTYADWLQQKVKGDFTHVLLASVLRSNPFFEEFRGFENLNWFRIFRETSTIRFVQTCICIRDRTLPDSLVRKLSTQDKQQLQDRQRANHQFISLYSEDYERIAPHAFESLLIKTVLTGLRLREYEQNRKYLARIQRTQLAIFSILSLLNTCRLQKLVNAAMLLKLTLAPIFKIRLRDL